MKVAALLLFCAASAFGTTCGTGWAHSGVFTVHPPTGVTVGQTAYPVRIGGAYASHLNAAGGIQHASGWDHCISDSGNTTTYPFQIIAYDSTNGLNDLIQYPSLAANPTTSVVTIWWGKSGVTVDPSSCLVWDSNFKSVYQLQESNFNYLDSTCGGTSLTIGTHPTQASGFFTPGFAQSFASASTQAMRGVSAMPASSTNQTISASIKTSSASTAIIADNRESPGFIGHAIYLNSSGQADCYLTGIAPDIHGSTDLRDNAPHHIACSYTSVTSTLNLFVDGVSVATNTGTATGYSSTRFLIGAADNASAYWDGLISDVRESNTFRSASWIAADAYNLLNPSSFVTFTANAGGAVDVVLTPGIL
jgi:hypothetical protein